jgi:hypothetical protein
VPLLQVSPAGQGDDKATFLAEFRALRDRAAIDCEELAVRAHYPTELIKEAESGPGLPGLPVLAAYVRACGGDVLEWEERWRRLANAVGHDTGLPTRPAGTSPAAVAGARAGVTISAAETHDAERIKAALRAHTEREERAGPTRIPAPQVSSLTDPRSPATMIANGNHHKKPHPDGFNAWLAPTPQTQTPEPEPAVDPATHAWAVPSETEEPGSAEPSWAAEPSARANEESWWTQETSSWTPDQPTWASDQLTRASDQPAWKEDPPAWTQEPSAWTQESPKWTPEAPARTADEPRQVIGAADEPASVRAPAETAGTARSWAAPAAPEGSVSQPPVAALRAASEATSQVTVAQAAAATSAGRRGARSGHRGLLVLVVLVVIIGCIALLSLT